MKFGITPAPEQNAALIKSFFAMGCIHIGLSFVDRQTLEDADKDPERYRTLPLRKYGFSEYKSSIPPGDNQPDRILLVRAGISKGNPDD